jgi:hypothetical protein
MNRNLGARERVKDPQEELLGGGATYVPSDNILDLSWLVTNYQAQTEFCGEHAATHFVAVLDHSANGAVNRYSPRYGVNKLKNPASPLYDGFPLEAGTTLPAIFKWLEQAGVDVFEPLENNVAAPGYFDPSVITPDDDAAAAQHKVSNFAYDALTFNALCQAVDEHKAVIILIKCDDGFWRTQTPTFTNPEDGHFIVACGHSTTALQVIDSADPDPACRIKMIDQKYVTPQFFIESGTARDVLPPAPSIPPAPTLPSTPTIQQELTWLGQLKVWFNAINEFLKGRNQSQ